MLRRWGAHAALRDPHRDTEYTRKGKHSRLRKCRARKAIGVCAREGTRCAIAAGEWHPHARIDACVAAPIEDTSWQIGVPTRKHVSRRWGETLVLLFPTSARRGGWQGFPYDPSSIGKEAVVRITSARSSEGPLSLSTAQHLTRRSTGRSTEGFLATSTGNRSKWRCPWASA